MHYEELMSRRMIGSRLSRTSWCIAAPDWSPPRMGALPVQAAWLQCAWGDGKFLKGAAVAPSHDPPLPVPRLHQAGVTRLIESRPPSASGTRPPLAADTAPPEIGLRPRELPVVQDAGQRDDFVCTCALVCTVLHTGSAT